MLIALTLILPTGLFFWAGRSVLRDLGEASGQAARSYLEVERAAAGATKNADRLIVLDVLGVASAVAAHLEYVFRTEPSLLDKGPDLTEHREIWPVLVSQRVGPTTVVSIVDSAGGRVVAHPECAHGMRLSDCMPLLARLLVDSAYERKRADAGELLHTRGHAPGMAYQRLLEYRFYDVPASTPAREAGEPPGRASPAGLRDFLVVTPLKGTPWSLAIQTRASGIFSGVYDDVSAAIEKTAHDLQGVGATVAQVRVRQVTALVAVVALGLLLVVFSGWWLRRTVVRPLTRLRATADRIRVGDLETRADVRTGDEIEVLADSMNFMLSHLTSSYQEVRRGQGELRELNESLERRVEERTRDLADANARLAAQAEDLRSLDELKRNFYANVSHELRTPLTLMLGLLRAAADRVGDHDATAAADLQVAGRNGAHLLRQINDLLDVARLEAGKMTLLAAPVDLVAVVRDVAAGFSPPSDQGRRLVLELPGYPLTAYLDVDKVRKVLWNLLSNAFKFTDPDRGLVAVRLIDGDAGGVTIEVADNGVGIPEASLPVVFERFRQVDSASTRKHEGTGIGLALVKELTELHGGRVEVESRVGAGTTFRLHFRRGAGHLPPDQVSAQPAEATAVSGLHRLLADSSSPRIGTEPGPGRRSTRPPDGPEILVVEDHRDLREYLVRLLRGHRVRAVENGAEALRAIAERAPDLVLSDVMMPEVDGYELCGRLKADPATAHVPVILLTAQVGLEAKVRGLQARADDYVTKPFQEEELLARVENLLLVKRQSEALRALNRDLEVRVIEQSEALRRRTALQRFLPPALAEAMLAEDAGATLERRRRLVGVLAARLCDFEELEAELGPEDLAALVLSFQRQATAAVFAHGGTLVGSSGAEVVAVFGAPRDLEEASAAKAATEAARALLGALDDIAGLWQALAGRAPLLAGAVEVGYATVGVFEAGDWASFSALGGPVWTAKMLRDACMPGELLVGPRVAKSLDPAERGQGPHVLELEGRTMEVWHIGAAPGAKPGEPAPPSQVAPSGGATTPIDPPARRSGPEVPVGMVDENLTGLKLGGRYQVERALGRGGMAAVYAARDELLDQRVAIKVIWFANIEWLRREVTLSRLVAHRNVCRTHDLYVIDGRVCLTMELIEGRSLRQCLRERQFSRDQPLAWVRQILDGLAAAHACGVVHRDLKPDNILVEDGTERIVIVDFGIARVAGGSSELSSGIVGTVDYLAPEALLCKSFDTRSDIYALGVVMYELLTGGLPFAREALADRVASAQRGEPPVDPAERMPLLNPTLRAVLLRCLEADPARRFQSVEDIAAVLAGVRSAFDEEAREGWLQQSPPGEPADASA